MNGNSLGFIGGGRITRIFLMAIRRSNAAFPKISVYDPDLPTLSKLKSDFPEVCIDSLDIGPSAGSDLVILALHPSVIMGTLAGITPFLRSRTIILSLAPKITIEKMQAALGGSRAIARANPSAAGIVHRGIHPVSFAENMSSAQRGSVLELLLILGKAPVVPEPLIEAYAVISAMGSTYFWFQLKHLRDLGMQFGMNEREADEAITEMIGGTVQSLFCSGLPPNQVMDLVPVRPLGDYEETIKGFYTDRLSAIFEKIRP